MTDNGGRNLARLEVFRKKVGRTIFYFMVRLFLSWFLKIGSQSCIDVYGEAEELQDFSLYLVEFC